MSKALDQILGAITEDVTILYWVQEGELRMDHELADVVLEAIKDKNENFSYVSERNEGGEMIAKVFIFGKVAVVEECWKPYVGYSWSERRLSLLKLKSPVSSNVGEEDE